MRTLTASATAAQNTQSARARITVTAHARGQNNDAPPIAWSSLVAEANPATFKACAAVGLADGSLLRFRNTGALTVKDTVADPTTAAGWAALTTATVIAALSNALAALRIPGTSTIRLFYIDGSGNLSYIQSADNGATWAAAVAVYSGGDAAADLVVAYIADGTVLNGPWFVGFSTYTGGSGAYAAYFAYDTGAGWTSTKYADNYRAAGIASHDPATTYHRVFVYRQQNYGASRLRSLEKTTTTYANPVDIDVTPAGLFGLILTGYRLHQLIDCDLAVAGEAAYQGPVYVGVAGYFYTEDPTVDETIIRTELTGNNPIGAFTLAETRDDGAGDLYLLTHVAALRGARHTPTTETLTPITYEYVENHFTISLPLTQPALAVGDEIRITRTLTNAADSGSQTLYAIVTATETGRKRQTIIAADPLAFLGISRLRRPATLSDGTTGLGQAMRQLAARAGMPLTVDNSALNTAATIPITLQPGESLRSAAYRVGSQANAYLVPAHDAFALELISPPTSDSGAHNDTPTAYPFGQTQLVDAASLATYNRLAFAYIFGSHSTDPEDGASLAMAAAAPLDNTRPIAYSLTNRRYNSAARVLAAATAEATRQTQLRIDARITTPPNLALELHDKITLTDATLGYSATAFRVVDWSETYNRGRLTQTLELRAL